MENIQTVISQSWNDLKSFRRLRKCVFDTARKLNISHIQVIEEVDIFSKGFRKEYRKLLKKYRKKLSHPKPVGKENRKLAENILNGMHASATGIRSGEVILGVRPTSKDATLIYYNSLGNPVPPREKDLNALRHFPDLYERFLDKLGAVDYFTPLTIEEREEWLEEYEEKGDVDISEVEGSEIVILSLGNSNFLNLEEESINYILSGKIPALSARDKFPGKPGSEGLKGRHTLIFYSVFWKISVAYKLRKSIDDVPEKTVIIDGIKGRVFKRRELKTNEVIYLFDNVPKEYSTGRGKQKVLKKQFLGILVKKSSGFVINRKNVLKIARSACPDLSDSPEIEKIFTDACKTFTPASYKSLMQKLVRFRCDMVTFPSSGKAEYPSQVVMVLCLVELLLNPGSFVPDIQRFVSGLESLTKRLAVTIFEDGCFENAHDSLYLLSHAFLAQRAKSWKPSKHDIRKYLDIGMQSVIDGRYYEWDIPKGIKLRKYTLSNRHSSFQNASAFLDELKSFESDLGMVRHLASEGVENITRDGRAPDGIVMPFEHCVDHHWAPEIVYFYPRELVKKDLKEGSKPFSQFLWHIFRWVTGTNPRKDGSDGKGSKGVFDMDDFESRSFVKETRRVQADYLTIRQSESITPELSNKTKKFRFVLDDDWLAGMVGALEISMRPKTLVSMKPGSIHDLIAVKKPSRGMKDATLTDEQTETAITRATVLLTATKGVTLSKSDPPLPFLKGARLRLKKGVYYILPNGKASKATEWNKLKKTKIEVGVIEDEEDTRDTRDTRDSDNLLYPISKDCIAIRDKYKSRISELIQEFDISEVRRALMYMSGFTNKFELSRVSRDGGGTKQSVVFEDVGAYQFLLRLVQIIPAGLRRVEGRALLFESSIGPLMWETKDFIAEEISKAVKYRSKKYGKIRDTLKRKMWEHQTECLQDMIERDRLGKRGHFLWLTVGLGKTKVILEYLKHLIRENRCPPHIIYSLPSSAMASVIQEIEAYGFTVRVHIPLTEASFKKHSLYGDKSDYARRGCDLEKYTISIIEHDHLRRCEEKLQSFAPNSIFIIDEVHKALNETKRTSVALAISNLSQDFIALTGTPIIDTHTYKLIWWLSQISQFSVNEKNFWVAANGMISRKVNTGVKVRRKEIVAPFGSSEEKEYRELVPAGLGGKNSNTSSADMKNAVEIAYRASRREMVKVAGKYLKKGIGVVMVGKDAKDVERLRKDMIKAGVKAKDIFVLQKTESIYFTDSTVDSGKTRDYKVVIVPIRKSEGYTLTRLNVMITGVYPSNNATREQISGRINRIGQSSDTVTFVTVHCGVLTNVLHNHADARNLSAVLQAIVEDVKM